MIVALKGLVGGERSELSFSGVDGDAGVGDAVW